MREILRRLFSRPGVAAELLVTMLFVTVLNLASPFFVMQILNRYISFGFDGTLFYLTLGMFVALGLLFGFSSVRDRVAAALGAHRDEAGAGEVFDALSRVRPMAVDSLSKAQAQELVGHVQTVQSAYEGPNIVAVLDAPFSLLYIGAAMFISQSLAIIGLCGMLIMYLAGWLAAGRGAGAEKEYEELSIEQRGHVLSALYGSDMVRVFFGGRFLRQVWERQLEKLSGLRLKLSENRDFFNTVSRSVTLLVSTILYAVGAMEVVHGDMNVGTLIGLNILISRAVGTTARLARTQRQLDKARTARAELRRFMDMPSESVSGATVDGYEGRLELRDVSMAFPGRSEPVFGSIDLKLDPGAMVVISGHNGAGKTTLARIVAGLIEPTAGSVLVDGVDLREISLPWWRTRIMYLPQEPVFLGGTLRENLTLGNPSMDHATLNGLVNDTDLGGFLFGSVKGLETPVGDMGRNLPLGTRRRLALARALAVGGPVAVLDEPTEGLDVAGCRAVYRLLARLRNEGRTIIAFSHDPVVVAMADHRVELGLRDGVKVESADPEIPAVPGEFAPLPSFEPDQMEQTAPVDPPQPRAVGGRAHALLACCCVFCFTFLGWASLATLDIVSMAAGEVIPSTKVKRIQHLEGGIISELLVKEGDQVTRGQPLVTLERTMQGSSVAEIEVRLGALRADEARLKAEAEGAAAPEFSPEIVEKYPESVSQARKLFEASRERLGNEKRAKSEEVVQLQKDIQKITARLTNNRKSFQLISRELEISESLLKDELTSELQHLRLQRGATKTLSKIREDEAALASARAALAEGRGKLENLEFRFREKAQTELGKVRRELSEFEQRLLKYSDTLKRTTIRAPEPGVVKALYAFSPGEVVKAGETIMILVPTRDLLVIEAHLPLQEVGYVHVGQGASIHLASSDARRFGDIPGKLTNISPDAFTDEKGRAFYTIRMETEQAYFEKDGNRYKLYPGMQVIGYIHTGVRTVLEYILSPYFIDSPGTIGTS